MARTPTIAVDLGYQAPGFQLPDVVSGRTLSFEDVRGEHATVVMFICNHCPFVVHVLDQIVSIGNDYGRKGIGLVAISSNDVERYPEDSPERMSALALSKHFPFPYLYDAAQEVAKAYAASCTPDLSVFDKDGRCVYRGQLDGSRPGNGVPVDGRDLRSALDCLIAGEPVSADQRPSLGCNIKWKPGNEPDYLHRL